MNKLSRNVIVSVLNLNGFLLHGSDCSQVFLGEPEPTYYKGTSVPDWKDYPDLAPEAKVSLLGEGAFGKVFRIENSPQLSFNVKFYKKIERTSFGESDFKLYLNSAGGHKLIGTEGFSQIGSDLYALELLHDLPEGSGFAYPRWFRIINYQRGKLPNTLELEDVKGWSLDVFLKKVDIPEERKKSMVGRYRELVEYFQKSQSDVVRTQEYDFQVNEHQVLGYSVYGIHSDNAILLKANNIIVESSTLDLVMIDPF